MLRVRASRVSLSCNALEKHGLYTASELVKVKMDCRSRVTKHMKRAAEHAQSVSLYKVNLTVIVVLTTLGMC